jgi:hypothetical protein
MNKTLILFIVTVMLVTPNTSFGFSKMGFYEWLFGLKIIECGTFQINEIKEYHFSFNLNLPSESKDSSFDKVYILSLASPFLNPDSPQVEVRNFVNKRYTDSNAAFLGSIAFELKCPDMRVIKFHAKPPTGSNGPSQAVKLTAFRLEGRTPSGRFELTAKIEKADSALASLLGPTKLWISCGGTK